VSLPFVLSFDSFKSPADDSRSSTSAAEVSLLLPSFH
jgi:hypothetical protein